MPIDPQNFTVVGLYWLAQKAWRELPTATRRYNVFISIRFFQEPFTKFACLIQKSGTLPWSL